MCLPEDQGRRASLVGSWSRVSLIFSVIKFDDEVVKEVGGCFARANSQREEELESWESLPEEEPGVRN